MRQGVTVDGFDAAFPLRQVGQWSPATLARRVGSGMLRHRAVVTVLLLFSLCALIMPTMTPAPVSDDWVYARSVEILVREHRLEIIDLSVVTLIFQIVWGGLFALLFGPTFGALRLSTLTLMLLGGAACYGLCRELRIDRSRSALGVAAFLFQPLAFVLGYSFMSDPQFGALLLIASYWYVRGLRPGPAGVRATLLGAGVAALAFLVRQQGALIPLAVVTYLVLCRRPRSIRAGLAAVARAAALPALAVVLYSLWLKYINGIPFRQGDFVQSVRDAGWGGTRDLVLQLLVIAALYIGFFALPVAVAALPRLPQLMRFVAPRGWLLLCGWVALVAAGVAAFAAQGRLMPYVPQFFGLAGLGPNDLQGERPPLVGPPVLGWFTAICAVGALLFGLILCRKASASPVPDRARAGLVLAIGLWQAVGILPASYSFREWGGSLDRYLLPLLPFAVCLGLWALRGVRVALPAAWLVVAALGLFAVVGTRDFLAFQRATWALAAEANALGIPNTRLDAGTSWDGYHLYEYSEANHIAPRTSDGPWWTGLFAPATDSSYVIASSQLPDFSVVVRTEYPSWLHGQHLTLYLLRRPDVAGPP